MIYIAHLKIKIQNAPKHGSKLGNLWVSFFPTNLKENHSYMRMMVDDPSSTPRKVQGAMVAWIAHLKEDNPLEIDNIKGNF